MIKKITNEDLESNAKDVLNDKKYGSDNKLIKEALENNPLNNDIAIVSMKICLIDITNGTNLSRNLGKEGGLYKLALKIVNSNFDCRVKAGDPKLVIELAKWTKEAFNKNLFSFISKYCLYHNVHCYGKDDYVIYDSILRDNIHKYISKDDYKNITGNTLRRNSLKKMIDEFDYETYIKIIDYILEDNTITVENKHRKLDWYIWYKNKK